jgi:7-cyano-7-deazaguanine reductase
LSGVRWIPGYRLTGNSFFLEKHRISIRKGNQMTPEEQAKDLKSLGAKKTEYPTSPDPSVLETFLNSNTARNYVIEFQTDEFTSLCPRTFQPDFATIKIRYVPNRECIESKSLKLFLFSHRNYGAFMERITNDILTALTMACKPRGMLVLMDFNPRGGIDTSVKAFYVDPSFDEDQKLEILSILGM